MRSQEIVETAWWMLFINHQQHQFRENSSQSIPACPSSVFQKRIRVYLWVWVVWTTVRVRTSSIRRSSSWRNIPNELFKPFNTPLTWILHTRSLWALLQFENNNNEVCVSRVQTWKVVIIRSSTVFTCVSAHCVLRITHPRVRYSSTHLFHIHP